MKNKLILGAAFLLAAITESLACTNLIVGKGASVDGSVIVSYSADSYGMFGELYHYPAGMHEKGTMRDIYDWDSGKYLGQIKEARQTYNVVGNMNEFQVTIGETTFGGREELVDSTGIMDYGSLIYVALQRSRTAKEAIQVMTDLVKEYGYYSSGESFSIADPNEVWILEMIGKGPGVKGAVWVAVRIPDDCIAAHANQSRIHQFNMNDKDNCLYSPDVISFAREKGYFDGMNKDFSFSAAYNPLDFGSVKRVYGVSIICSTSRWEIPIFLIFRGTAKNRCLFISSLPVNFQYVMYKQLCAITMRVLHWILLMIPVQVRLKLLIVCRP